MVLRKTKRKPLEVRFQGFRGTGHSVEAQHTGMVLTHLPSSLKLDALPVSYPYKSRHRS